MPYGEKITLVEFHVFWEAFTTVTWALFLLHGQRWRSASRKGSMGLPVSPAVDWKRTTWNGEGSMRGDCWAEVPFIRQQYWSGRHWWKWCWQQFYLSAPKRSCQARTNIVTPQLTASLDQQKLGRPSKLTDQSAVQVLSAAASALWHDSSKLAINRSLFRRSRRAQKKAIADEIRSSYASNTSLVVHWDCKQLPNDRKQNVDRLPVIVTDPQRTAKLLGTTKLPAGNGRATDNAIMECLVDCQLSDYMVGMSFDTTSRKTNQHLVHGLLCSKNWDARCFIWHAAITFWN